MSDCPDCARWREEVALMHAELDTQCRAYEVTVDRLSRARKRETTYAEREWPVWRGAALRFAAQLARLGYKPTLPVESVDALTRWPVYLTSADAGRQLGISRAAVSFAHKAGTLTKSASTSDGSPLFLDADVDAYRTDHLRKHGNSPAVGGKRDM